MQSQMVDLDGKAIKQASLIREAKANEANYLLYLASASRNAPPTLSTKEGSPTSRSLCLHRSRASGTQPSDRHAARIHSRGFRKYRAAFLADYMDSSFLTPDEVGDALNLPVLASVPRRAA